MFLCKVFHSFLILKLFKIYLLAMAHEIHTGTCFSRFLLFQETWFIAGGFDKHCKNTFFIHIKKNRRNVEVLKYVSTTKLSRKNVHRVKEHTAKSND